jgi:hypothetical protein
LAQKLISLAGADDFVLLCALPNETLIQLQNPGITNNYCVLHLNPSTDNHQRIIGTTLNQPLVASNPGDPDFISAIEFSFFNMSYPDLGATFDSTCTNTTKDFARCVDNDYLKLYYDDNYQMVVFSDAAISGLNPNLGDIICSALPSWLKWLCPNPSSMELNFENLKLFNKVYATKQDVNEIFGVAEQVCNLTSHQKTWIYAFNYTGFGFPGDFIISSLNADKVIISANNIFISNPKKDAWQALTLLRNPEQE